MPNNLIKKLVILSLIFLLNINLNLYSTTKKSNTITIHVLGMVCSFCATSIEKSFNKEKAVKSVNVNLDSKTVVLFLKPNTNISNKEITKIIEYSGYKVKKIIK